MAQPIYNYLFAYFLYSKFKIKTIMIKLFNFAIYFINLLKS